MTYNRPLLRYCCDSLGDRRIWVSASLSAALWFLPLFAVDFFASGRTSDGWRLYWDTLPFGLALAFGKMLAIALLMHLLFRERVQRLSGKSFWLFPIIALSVAALLYSSGAVLATFFQESRHGSIGRGWIMIPVYWWVGALLVVFYHIWITYPLAIINQVMIRKVFGTSRG